MNLLNTFLLLITVFFTVFAESALDISRRILGAQIDLLPAFVVYAGLNGDLFTLVFVAIGGGLLFDALSANPLGASILPLFSPGLVLHLKRGLILREQWTAQCVLGLIACGTVPALTVLMLFSAGETPLLGWGSLWQWFVMCVVGGICTPVVFRWFQWMNDAFSYRRAVATSFRADRQIRRGRKP